MAPFNIACGELAIGVFVCLSHTPAAGFRTAAGRGQNLRYRRGSRGGKATTGAWRAGRARSSGIHADSPRECAKQAAAVTEPG